MKGDFDVDAPNLALSKVVTHGSLRIGFTHGHTIIPPGDADSLLIAARQLDVDVLLWGGTHKFEAYEMEGKFFVNPGSATGAMTTGWWPEAEDPTPSFVLMDVSGSTVFFLCGFVVGHTNRVDGRQTATDTSGRYKEMFSCCTCISIGRMLMGRRMSPLRNCPSGRMEAGYRSAGEWTGVTEGTDGNGLTDCNVTRYELQKHGTSITSLASLDTVVLSAVALWLHKRLPASSCETLHACIDCSRTRGLVTRFRSTPYLV